MTTLISASMLDFEPTITAIMRNRIINGSMHYAQRGTSFTGLSNGDTQHTLDRWRFRESGAPTGVIDIKQTADHPLTPNGYCSEIDVTTSDTPAAGDVIEFRQTIEGQFLQDLKWGTSAAENLTLSFWVKSYQTGNFAVSFYHTDAAESYVVSFTVNASDTWEQKTIILPGHTTAAIDNDNTVGLFLRIILMAGGDFETTTGSWQAGDFVSFSGATNILSSTSNNFRITDVQLEKGSVATPFENRLLGGLELSLCQRYCLVFDDQEMKLFGMGITTNTVDVATPVPVSFRDVPAISYNDIYLVNRSSGTSETSSITGLSITGSRHTPAITISSSGAFTQGANYTLTLNSASSYVILDAEP